MPFDLNRLEMTGVPVPIIEGIMQSEPGAAHCSFSRLGTLVYVPGSLVRHAASESLLVWVDRKGNVESLPAPPRAYRFPRLSPDRERVALVIEDDVWIYDIPRDTLTRLTFDGSNAGPIWTPDGKRVTFVSLRAGAANLFWKAADGSGSEERLTASQFTHIPSSWSPDGRLLAFIEIHPTTGPDIWVLPIQGEREPYPLLRTPFDEYGPNFSPDGRWLAYASNESGRVEVYVQPFPGPGGKWQVSSEGATRGLLQWSRDGQELFYRNGDKMMVVEITTSPAFRPAKPKLLFEGRFAEYDVSPDGQRFLAIQPVEPEQPATQITVVLNWFEELRRRVPAAK